MSKRELNKKRNIYKEREKKEIKCRNKNNNSIIREINEKRKKYNQHIKQRRKECKPKKKKGSRKERKHQKKTYKKLYHILNYINKLYLRLFRSFISTSSPLSCARELSGDIFELRVLLFL